MPTAVVAGLLGVDSANGPNAGLVLGCMPAHGERVPLVSEDSAPHKHTVDSLDAGRDLAAESSVVHRPPTGLYIHRSRSSPRDGGLQSVVVASNGLEHTRPTLLFADSRSVADAVVSHECSSDIRARGRGHVVEGGALLRLK